MKSRKSTRQVEVEYCFLNRDWPVASAVAVLLLLLLLIPIGIFQRYEGREGSES